MSLLAKNKEVREFRTEMKLFQTSSTFPIALIRFCCTTTHYITPRAWEGTPKIQVFT